MARRPRQIPTRIPLSAEQIASATYVGSDEHKDRRWWGGLGGAYVGRSGVATRPKKLNTSICPMTTATDRETATCWVRCALRSGQLIYLEGDKDFPSRIWYRDPATAQSWSGYCVNGILGQYKGWPIEEDERRAVFGRLA